MDIAHGTVMPKTMSHVQEMKRMKIMIYMKLYITKNYQKETTNKSIFVLSALTNIKYMMKVRMRSKKKKKRMRTIITIIILTKIL